jgi:RimJ/RimL family protein N-acetyltransferase
VDRELELVTPDERWIDGLLQTLADPLTRELSPKDTEMTREQVTRFVRDHPLGRQKADPQKGLVPAYHFWMRLRPELVEGLRPELVEGLRPEFNPPVQIAGGINLRIGNTPNIQIYLGNIGYSVYPPARGRHYARRAVRLLLPLARRMGVNPVWITCNPENMASRRTCEGAGGRLVEIVRIPPEHALYARGERAKCRYRFDL